MIVRGRSTGTMAIKNDLERTLSVAVFAVTLLLCFVFTGESANVPPAPMPRCGDVGALCMSDLAYAPGERQSVSVARLEVK